MISRQYARHNECVIDSSALDDRRSLRLNQTVSITMNISLQNFANLTPFFRNCPTKTPASYTSYFAQSAAQKGWRYEKAWSPVWARPNIRA